jgi:hypothetical protein
MKQHLMDQLEVIDHISIYMEKHSTSKERASESEDDTSSDEVNLN